MYTVPHLRKTRKTSLKLMDLYIVCVKKSTLCQSTPVMAMDQSPIALMYIKDLAYLDPTIRISLLLIPTCLFWMFLKVSQSPYISLITVTIWLFNSSPWKITIFKFGKPSISMGHLYHGYVSHNQRVVIIHQIPILAAPQPVFHGELSMLLAEKFRKFPGSSFPEFPKATIWL